MLGSNCSTLLTSALLSKNKEVMGENNVALTVLYSLTLTMLDGFFIPTEVKNISWVIVEDVSTLEIWSDYSLHPFQFRLNRDHFIMKQK